MIDRVKFDDYVSAYGKEFFLTEVIEVFMLEYGERMEKIQFLVQTQNFQELVKAVHSIRSASCNFWDPVTIRDSIDLERLACSSATDGLDDAFQQFAGSMKDLMDELQMIRDEFTA